MLYAEICPNVRRHNALPFRVLPDRALCFLTLGNISAYNMDNTILLYKYKDSPTFLQQPNVSTQAIA